MVELVSSVADANCGSLRLPLLTTRSSAIADGVADGAWRRNSHRSSKPRRKSGRQVTIAEDSSHGNPKLPTLSMNSVGGQIHLPLLSARSHGSCSAESQEDLVDEITVDDTYKSFLDGFLQGELKGRKNMSLSCSGCTRKSMARNTPRQDKSDSVVGRKQTLTDVPDNSMKRRYTPAHAEYFQELKSIQDQDNGRSSSRGSRIVSPTRSGSRQESPAFHMSPEPGDGRASQLGRASPSAPRTPRKTPESPLPGRSCSPQRRSPSPSQRTGASSKRGSVPPKKSRCIGKSAETVLARQREACESLRILVFGRVGNEDWPMQERRRIFDQRRGTSVEVSAFVETWCQMDFDDSGDVDFNEFIDYFTKRKTDRLLGMRCVRYLIGVGHELEEHDSSPASGHSPHNRRPKHKKRNCNREDMMRLLWLRARDDDIEAMEEMFDLHKLYKVAVNPLPLLSKRRRRELLENFKELDIGDTGVVPYTALVDAGLADEEIMSDLQGRYDKDRNGTMDFEEFIEMLSPYGFRAHEGVKIAVMKDGQLMRHATCMCGEHKFTGWLMDADFQSLKGQYNLSNELG